MQNSPPTKLNVIRALRVIFGTIESQRIGVWRLPGALLMGRAAAPSAALWVAGVAKGDGGTVGLLLASEDSSAAAPCALPLLSAGWPPFWEERPKRSRERQAAVAGGGLSGQVGQGAHSHMDLTWGGPVGGEGG